MKRPLLALLSCILSATCIAQSHDPSESFALTETPPSPTAAAFAKYGDIPVSYYTGVPSIEVPLYTISVPGLSVPVSLSYHAGGIKVAEEPGPVGLGWTLQCGGIITRVKKDQSDFAGFIDVPFEMKNRLAWNCGTFNATDQDNGTCFVTDVNGATYSFQQAIDNMTAYDWEYDIFTFSYPGKSGKFIIDRSGNVVLEKYDDIKVIPHVANDHCTGFTIIDEQGIKYDFLQVEQEINTSEETSWHLTKITHPNARTINYTYDYTVINGIPQVSEIIYESCNTDLHPPVKNTYYSYYAYFPTTIQFDNGYIKMLYPPNITDHTGVKQLNGIEVYANNSTTPVKKYDFIFGNFNASTSLPGYKRRRLDEVIERSPSSRLPAYKFKYNEDESMIPFESKAVDHWGFYNKATTNTTFIPEYDGYIKNPSGFTEYVELPGANRETDAIGVKVFSLKEMTYPTGGRTVFDFQVNTFDQTKSRNGYTNELDGHMNIVTKSQAFTIDALGETTGEIDLTNIFHNAVTAHITFRCDDCGPLHGSSNVSATVFDLTRSLAGNLDTCNVYVCTTEIQKNVSNGVYNWSTFIDPNTQGFQGITIRFVWQEVEDPNDADPYTKYDICGGLRIARITNYDERGNITTTHNYDYHFKSDSDNDGIAETFSYGRRMSIPSYYRYQRVQVKDYVAGETGETSGKYCIAFARLSNSTTASASTSIVGYDQVTEYITDKVGHLNGKTVYSYENISDEIIRYQSELSQNLAAIYEMRRPGILNLGHCRNGLMKTQTQFASLSDGTFKKLRETTNTYTTKSESIYQSLSYETIVDFNQPYYLMAFYPALHAEKVVLDSTVEKTFDGPTEDQYLKTVTRYTYGNSNHIFPTSVARSRSNAPDEVENKLYPMDVISGLSAEAQVAKDSLVRKHIIAPPLLAEKIQGSSVERRRNNYKLFNNKPLISSIETQFNTSPYVTRFRYLDYDNSSNLLSQGKDQDAVTSYVWGYNNLLPVAEVVNANSNQIFYTGFEENGQLDAAAKGGDKVKASGFSQHFTTLPSGSYWLTYWTRVSSSATWTYNKSQVSVSGNYDINISAPFIDEVRLYPIDAQIKSYNYKPLIGVTSMMDTNGQTVYYVYDEFNRLSVIRDDKNQILKTYKYNYHFNSDYTNDTPRN